MTRSQDFADALTRLEADGDVSAMAARFAPGAELGRPEQGALERGEAGARHFWQTYLDQFETVSSTFSRVVDDGALGELEWVSEGRLSTGRGITCAGVSLLVHDEAGAIVRFATYYDTAAFAAPA